MEQLSCLEIDGKQLEIADESARNRVDTAINTANTAKSTAESAQSTANTAKSTADSAMNAAETATAIAKGRNQAHVFNTTDAMKAWLSDANNKGIYNKGDNIYIVDVGVPDWWVSEVLQDADSETGYYYKIAQLETQKVDLTEINAEISQINSSLADGQISFSVVNGEPYVKVGADTPRPFKSGIKLIASNLRGNTEQTIDVSKLYDNYSLLTASNFLVEIVSLKSELNASVRGVGNAALQLTYVNGKLSITKGNIGVWNLAYTDYDFSAYPIYNVYIK